MLKRIIITIVAMLLGAGQAQAQTPPHELMGFSFRCAPRASAPPSFSALHAVGIWCPDSGASAFKLTLHQSTIDFLLGEEVISTLGTQGNFHLGSQLFGADANINTWLLYQPNDGSSDPFIMATGQFDVGTQARPDQVFTLGWDLTPGGSRHSGGVDHGAMGLSFEQLFYGSHHQMEGHWLYVDPADQQHRPISMLGNLTAPYDINLMIGAEQVTLFGGRAPSSSGPQLSLSATQASLYSGDGGHAIYIDNANFEAITKNLDGAGTIFNFGYNAGSGVVLESSIDLQGNLLLWHDNAGMTRAGTGYVVGFTADGYLGLSSTSGVRPYDDSVQFVGGPDKRFQAAIVGGPTRATCDEPHRGATMTVFAAGGASDTFQVCMKSAADAYAWRTVFTAP